MSSITDDMKNDTHSLHPSIIKLKNVSSTINYTSNGMDVQYTCIYCSLVHSKLQCLCLSYSVNMLLDCRGCLVTFCGSTNSVSCVTFTTNKHCTGNNIKTCTKICQIESPLSGHSGDNILKLTLLAL